MYVCVCVRVCVRVWPYMHGCLCVCVRTGTVVCAHTQVNPSPPSCCRYGILNVIIYGQSIGTVPSVDLAARYESAAVILHSPLTSGMRVAFPDTKKTYCFDAFPK